MPETPDDGNNPERPEWLPENFKTPEDMARSYREAQDKIREQGVQLNAQNESLQTFAQQLELLATQQNHAPQADPSQVTNHWAEMYESDPLGTIVLLNQQLNEQNVQAIRQEISQLAGSQRELTQEQIGVNAAATMKERYADWNALRDEVAAELENNPVFADESPVWNSLVGATAAFDQAYRNVKLAKAAEGGYTTVFTARDMKLQAQGLSGAGGRPAPEDEQKESWDRIRNAGFKTYSEMMGSGR